VNGKLSHDSDHKKAGLIISMSDKVDFKTKSIDSHKIGHLIMIKESIYQEDVIIINVHTID
jgi:hypothetical protein